MTGEGGTGGAAAEATCMGAFTHTTAMCWAAAEGNLEAMRRLREHGADVNVADYDKRTPLHIAVSDNQLEMVDYLLQCGADVEALDRWGRSAIDCALEAKNVAILRLLEREHYSSVNRKFSAFDAKARRSSIGKASRIRRSRSSTDLGSFFRAVKEGNTEKVKRSWLDGMEMDVTDVMGRTSLHVAVENGQLGVIELLLSAGVNTTVIDSHGRSPMSIALENQDFAVVEMLRAYQKQKHEAHEMKGAENQEHIARAFRVAKQGDLEDLKLLVPEFVRADVQDYDLRTLLHIASAEGYLAIAKYLVDCGANVNLLDRWGTSPLSDAVDFAHNELARYLIAHHATESGYRATVATDHIDNATLNSALEFTLRVVTRGQWVMGQVYCPVVDVDESCILVAHSIWQKNGSVSVIPAKTQSVLSPRSSRNLPDDTESLWADSIQKYRKATTMLMIDPGQGHTGSVFSGQHPEWLNLTSAQQSQFFLLPHARRAGLQTVVSAPMVCKMSTVAVLSWYSDRVVPEDAAELQRIQRVIRSVMILCTLREELANAMSSKAGAARIPRFQYCQTLDNAITANGELTDTSIRLEDLRVGDTTPLALEWGLFDMVNTLATSMSSEDHAAVVPILRSLVVLLRNGLFRDALREHSSDEPEGEESLAHVIEASGGQIRTKWALLGHLKYYLQYLYAVSPTEGHILSDVTKLSSKVEQYLQEQAKAQDSGDDDAASSSNAVEMEVDDCSGDQTAAEPADVPEADCVLCKYNVPGHMHPGQKPIPIAAPPARSTPFYTKTSKSPTGERFFGIPGNPKSPIQHEIDLLLPRLEGEYDAFERKPELTDYSDSTTSNNFTSSDLYDAIGASHESPRVHKSADATNPRTRLLGVINEIIQDTSCMISYDQLFALHECLLPASSGQGGVLRTDLAVGYASSRIYRVFLPAGEVPEVLRSLVEAINDSSRWQQRPLLCAYYAFAVLVFYIHPFHDGNGRCARLLGNLIAKKLGYPPLLRAADKTIQLAEFLQKANVTMEIIRNTRRQTRQARQTRTLSTRRENSSMWF